MEFGGSNPFPGRKHSVAPCFGYALSVMLTHATSPKVRGFHLSVCFTRRDLHCDYKQFVK